MKSIRILATEKPGDDLKFWLKKSSEERIDAVEFLREQFYAIQGYTLIPRIKKVVCKVEMEE
jgi:hypothetical protein